MPVFPGCHLTQRGKSEVLSEGSLVPLPLSHGIVCSRPYHAHHGPLCFWYRNLVRRHEDFSHLRHPVWLILKRSKSAHTHLCALSPAPRASLTSPSAITSRVRVGAGIPSGRGPVSSGVSETHIVFVMSSCALSYELMQPPAGSNPRLLDQVIICIQEVQTKTEHQTM